MGIVIAYVVIFLSLMAVLVVSICIDHSGTKTTKTCVTHSYGTTCIVKTTIIKDN